MFDFYLLVILIALILPVSSYILYTSEKGAFHNTGRNMRRMFLRTMALGGFLRCISLVVIVLLGNPEEDNLKTWINDLMHTFPTLFFIIAYMLLIQFFAHLYYSIRNQEYPITRRFTKSLDVTLFFVWAIIAIVTVAIKEYWLFLEIITGVLGVVFLAITFLMINYVVRLIIQLHEIENEDEELETEAQGGVSSTKDTSSRGTLAPIDPGEIFKRAFMLGLIFSLVTFTKGIYNFLYCTAAIDEYYPSHLSKTLFDFLVYTITEVVPLCHVALMGFTPKPRALPDSSQSIAPVPNTLAHAIQPRLRESEYMKM
mmetsp:Transcript_33690/g.38304  ORF Transcript_33690/g.38304 Transcript_33690/m.38304 type:complete len:313 (-) Transcript_33690:176-1114(-)